MEQFLRDVRHSVRMFLKAPGFTLTAIATLTLGIGAQVQPLDGLMAYSVQQRTQEIGIWSALGADSRRVRNMVVFQGMGLSMVGIVSGIAAAFGVSRVLATLLFGVTTRDPMVFVSVPVILGLVALAAVWIPARRASRVDPLTALRHD